jgi:formylglycine-generating enzyme required for sulfatase activity
MRFISEENDDGYATIAPVESFLDGATWVGALNMAGNVWEWTNSIDKPYPYDATDGREDPADRSSLRIMRGGSFRNAVGNMRTTNRDAIAPTENEPQFGLRCVLAAD